MIYNHYTDEVDLIYHIKSALQDYGENFYELSLTDENNVPISITADLGEGTLVELQIFGVWYSNDGSLMARTNRGVRNLELDYKIEMQYWEMLADVIDMIIDGEEEKIYPRMENGKIINS